MKEKEKQLQDLSAGLPVTRARFSADDVRVRLGRAPRLRWRPSLVAAAVIALAVTHAGAFLLGRDGKQEAPLVAPSPIAETERILTRASRLDESAPHEILLQELGELRRSIRAASLPGQLGQIHDARGARFADALSQLDNVLDSFSDPGFSAMLVTRIARASLEGSESIRLLPAGTHAYARIRPLGRDRFRVYIVDAIRGTVVNDTGTLKELREQHPEIHFVSGE